MKMKIDRKSECKYCRVCHKNFNHSNNKPVCLIPCGHTFCMQCSNGKFKNNQCPSCKESYNQIIPDYEMIDMLNSLVQLSVSISDDDEIIQSTSEEELESSNEAKKYNNNQIGISNNKILLREEVIHLIQSGTKDQQLIGTQSVRKLLSVASNPPIQEIINAGLVPKLIEFLDAKNKTLQFEAAWALTNIASGSSSQTNEVVNCGAIPHFIRLISSNNDDLVEQSIWALGNIAGDSCQYRDLVIDQGILPSLLNVLSDKSSKSSVKKNAVRCFSNLCRGKNPPVDLSKLKPAYSVINSLLSESYSEAEDDILIDTCWSISYLSDGSNDKIQLVLDNFDIKHIVTLMRHTSLKILIPTLRIIGNIASGDDMQTQVILQHGVLGELGKLLNHHKSSIRKEACWTISNITAGTKNQIQLVIDENIIPKVVEIYRTDQFNVKKEVVWVLANAMTSTNQEQIDYFISQSSIEVFLEVMAQRTENKMVLLALESVEKLLVLSKLDTDSPNEKYANVVKEKKIETYLEDLQHHSNEEINSKAVNLLESYFFDFSNNDENENDNNKAKKSWRNSWRK